jgi:DNA repair protein RadC
MSCCGRKGCSTDSCDPPDDLARVAGVGAAKAAQLIAAVELGRRTLGHSPRHARSCARRVKRRHTYCLRSDRGRSNTSASSCCDTKHRVLRTTVVAIGTLNTTVVQPRSDVFREAVLGAAASVVVFHHSPSGDPSPSPDDVELTARLAAAGALMGIEMIDHIVLGDTRTAASRKRGASEERSEGLERMRVP